MKRCLVSLPVPENQTVAQRRAQMKELADRIEVMHPDTVIESMGVLFLTVQVVDALVPVLRRSLGCFVDDTVPQPPDKARS